jgi:hypothetical protein
MPRTRDRLVCAALLALLAALAAAQTQEFDRETDPQNAR